MFATSKELGAIKGISEQKVLKLKEIGELGAGRQSSTAGRCSQAAAHHAHSCSPPLL